MQITARADYAVRALAELASRTASATRVELAQAQDIPPKFLEAILSDLKKAGIVVAQRGSAGGYVLARPAADVSIADVVRAVDGPLAAVRGLAPESVRYTGPAESLTDVWVAVRASIRAVLESVTVDDVVTGRLPPEVQALLVDDDAYRRR